MSLQLSSGLSILTCARCQIEHLFSKHDGYFQKVEIPTGAILEFSYLVRGFATGQGYIQHIIAASDGKIGMEIHERTNITIITGDKP
jgi:hypothetical protein